MDLLTVSRIYHFGGTLMLVRAAVLVLVLLVAMALRWHLRGSLQTVMCFAQRGVALLGLGLAGGLVAMELLVFKAGAPLCLLASLALLAAFALGLAAPGWKAIVAVLSLAAVGLGYLFPFGTVPKVFLVAEPAPRMDLESAMRRQGDGPLLLQSFEDFQCPACARMDRTLERFLDQEPGRATLVYRHLPLPSIHPWALRAAVLSECAARQGKFREVKRALFERQDELSRILRQGYEESWGLPDPGAFRTCVEARQTEGAVQKDMAEARRLGLRSTPSVLVDQTLVVGSVPPSRLEAVLDFASRHRNRPASNEMMGFQSAGCGGEPSGGDCSAP